MVTKTVSPGTDFHLLPQSAPATLLLGLEKEARLTNDSLLGKIISEVYF